MKTAVILLIVIAAGIGVAIARDGDGGDLGTAWSPIVYPEQRLPLEFSHRLHVQRGATCTTCHAEATTSRSAVDNLIPTEAACRACHAIERDKPDKAVAGAPPTSCRTCHPGWLPNEPVARVFLMPTPLKFDHSRHTKQPCARCHTDMTKVDLATTKQLPTMSSCLQCHRDDERHCADCHLTKRGGLVETKLPHGDLVPLRGEAHGPNFVNDHKQEARRIGATCEACHDRSECVDCHQGVVKPTSFHTGDYLVTHPVEAKRGRPDCSACHRYETFCVACHERSGIARRGDTQFDGSSQATAFHPPGWATQGAGPNRHASEARKNIASCSSCHRDEDCMTCHTAEPGKGNISPHPPNWRASSRCRALDRGNRRMCLRCHITQNEIGCDWKAP